MKLMRLRNYKDGDKIFCNKCRKYGKLKYLPKYRNGKKSKNTYPLIWHYSSKLYQQQKQDYNNGTRKGKPSGISFHYCKDFFGYKEKVKLNPHLQLTLTYNKQTNRFKEGSYQGRYDF
jgi:hypothetical protein